MTPHDRRSDKARASATAVSQSDSASAKLGYLSGPVDAREIYRALRDGGHTSLFGTSYLMHFMRLCERQGREAIIVTTHGEHAYDVRLGLFTIANRPQPPGRRLKYHWRQIRWTRDRIAEIEAAGARTCVLTAAQHYWFVSRPFRKRGLRFINSYHCAVRAYGHSRLTPHEAMIRLTSWLHLSYGDPTMVIVPTIVDELAREAGAKRRQVLQILPDYPSQIFASFEAPQIASQRQATVRVMFAGRVTRNKGVFDILAIAKLLAARIGPRIEFHLHGDGDALVELRAAVSELALEDLVVVHGFTPGSELAAHYAAADIVIVPTRSDFDEGIAKSVVEGVLTLRPVVTSRACPSIGILADACFEAKVDDPASYADAIWRLATDPDLASQKAAAALRLRTMFFDPAERYDKRLARALDLVETRTRPG